MSPYKKKKKKSTPLNAILFIPFTSFGTIHSAETTGNGLRSAKVRSTAVHGERLEQKNVSVVEKATGDKFDSSECL